MSFASTKPVSFKSAAVGQRGASLIMVMIILTIVSMLGIAGIQISAMSERGARNDRDYQIAWQSAEAGLLDAEIDVSNAGTSTRRNVFSPKTNTMAFYDGCGNDGDSRGLCAEALSGKPAWLVPDFGATGNAAFTAEYGSFTGRSFTAGGAGFQPAKRPRYVIEILPDQFGSGSAGRDLTNPDTKYVYRVTAMGFGPRDDIQAVVQTIFRN